MPAALITLMALGIVLLDIGIVIKVLALFNQSWRRTIVRMTREYGLLTIFIFSTLTVVATLWFQYGDNLNPCLFCWWQRIFMYPIPIISLIAMIKGKRLSDIADYVIVLSVLGAAVALYQHLLQVLPSGTLIPCDASGDCAIRSVFEFGFITLPWMALTAFVAIGLIAFLGRKD